jgi:hypothetical protein
MRSPFLALLLALLGCEGTSAHRADPGGSSGHGGGTASCRNDCVAENSEDCDGCWKSILDCCYTAAERTNAEPAKMAEVCAGSPVCRACCNECAARSCDEHKAAGDCPNL